MEILLYIYVAFSYIFVVGFAAASVSLEVVTKNVAFPIVLGAPFMLPFILGAAMAFRMKNEA